ncbi:MAG: type II secretion system F family protein [Armatimonadota bacterium]|jgi:type IV pilus assembly protein PilC
MFGTAQARERAEVFGELAAMVRAGISIGEALTVVAKGMPPSRMRSALMQAGREVSGGQALGVSMERHQDIFSPLTLAMVQVGERGGRLDEALRGIADYFERDFRLRSLLKRELTYPIILAVAILFIPLVGNMIRLWITRGLFSALAAATGQLLVYALVLGVPGTLAYLLIGNARRSRQGREQIDRIRLSLPLIGSVARKLALARFCRALASLYSAGVLMGTALRLAGQASGNAIVERELGGRARRVEAGASLTEVLSESPLMPATVLSMFRTGERTGDVDAMAHNVADHLEREAETAIRQMVVAITPVAVLIAGIIVALMVVGFYANLYSF